MPESVKWIDSWSLLTKIRVGTESNKIPPLAEKFYTIRLQIKVVFLVFPIVVVGDVQDTVFLHGLDDGLEIFLSWWHILQYDTVFDALTVCQGITDTERVIEPRTQTVLADVLDIGNIVSVFATILVGYINAEHIPNDITPIVESSFGNLYASTNVIIKPFLIQFLEWDFLGAIDSFYHPDIFAYQALASIIVCHLPNFMLHVKL